MSVFAEKFLSLAVFVAMVAVVAALGALFSPDQWYAALAKPAWNPPNWVFGPVWTILYAMIAVAGWLLWLRRREPKSRAALVLFALQLVVNALWSWLFFGLKSPALALLDITVMWLLIAATVAMSFQVHRAAGWLLIPYWAWVSFAAALNLAIWQLN